MPKAIEYASTRQAISSNKQLHTCGKIRELLRIQISVVSCRRPVVVITFFCDHSCRYFTEWGSRPAAMGCRFSTLRPTYRHFSCGYTTVGLVSGLQVSSYGNTFWHVNRQASRWHDSATRLVSQANGTFAIDIRISSHKAVSPRANVEQCILCTMF
jgi:hypothetical protein